MTQNFEEDNAIFDENFRPLNRIEALKIFGERALTPSVGSPWQIVKFQSVLTIAFTILSVIWSFSFFQHYHLVASVIMGGVLGIIPSAGFILRVQIGKKEKSRFAQGFVSNLVKAEVIKLTLSIAILALCLRNLPNLNWLVFFGMYFITLQSYWMAGLLNRKVTKGIGKN
jgi:F0F1-type ATP synthase assembly protein I